MTEHSSGEGDVSVFVPSYNHAPFVGETLRSIFRQTLAPRELLVIDDGSTDDSARQIARVLEESPFPSELIVRGNRGLCATLNEGLARTRGRYFAYLGSDDLWLPDFLKARVKLLAGRPQAVLGYGHALIVDEQTRIVDCTADWAVYADGDARPMLRRAIAPMSPTVVYRREALARHNWRENSRLEDFDLYLRLSPEGEFAFDERVLAAWRRHGSNTSRDQRMMLAEQLQALDRHAAALNLSREALRRQAVRLAFARSEDLLRLGHKREALQLAVEHYGGATPRALARMLARLLVPYSLVRRRAQRRAAAAAERYNQLAPPQQDRTRHDPREE
jgi:alpha-1,3-rhamnosyltransferase